MITASVKDVRQNWEVTLGRSLAHVPAEEWKYYRSVDGLFKVSDWDSMPVLFGELTRGHR